MNDLNFAEFSRQFDIEERDPGLQVAPLHLIWRFSLKTSAEALWPHIANTSLFNREMGLPPRIEREENGRTIVRTKMLGLNQEWIEEPWTWIKEKSMQSIRVYRRGFAKFMLARFILEPTSAGVDFYVHFSWYPANIFWRYFLQLTSPLLKKMFIKTLQKIEHDILTHQSIGLKKNLPENSKINMQEIERVVLELKRLPLEEKAIDVLADLIKTGDDSDLFRIRPVEIAKNANLEKKDFLLVSMHAVRKGLLNISWDVICPHCRGVRLAVAKLGDLPSSANCDVCNIDFTTDKLESIEVVFHILPQFRKVEEIVFCSAEPAKKQHILMQSKVGPQQKIVFTGMLEAGMHRIRSSQLGQITFLVNPEKEPSDLAIDFSQEVLLGEIGSKSRIKISNSGPSEDLIVLEQLWWQDNVLRPYDVFQLTEFRDLFSVDSLQSDIKISFGTQVILFTDIVSSTEFYNKLGDAAAFNEVKKHFDVVFRILNEEDGTIVKTIGDSVMAAFLNPNKALFASLRVQEYFDRTQLQTSIRLRISMHLGPVMGVNLSQGLDFFGKAVNKAAKLQACAGAGEIALSEEMHQACDPKLISELAAYTALRQSSLRFNDMELNAHVIDVFKRTEAKKDMQDGAKKIA